MEKGWLELKRFFANARSCVEGKKALLLGTVKFSSLLFCSPSSCATVLNN